MVPLGICIPLLVVYGAAALIHLILLVPGGYVKAHVNLLAVCGHVIMIFAFSVLFVSDVTTLVTGWFWFFVLAASVIYYLVIAFYLFTDRTARLGGLACELSANLVILLLLLNPIIADNIWVKGMLVLFGIALISLSSIISLFYRFRHGWRPVAILAINLIAHAVVIVSVLMSPKFVGAGSPVLWDALIASGLVVQHVVVSLLCMWYTEANSSVRDFPVIATWMGIEREIEKQGGVFNQAFPTSTGASVVITSSHPSLPQNEFRIY
ncbi:MAG: hypothetical protein AB7P49_00145 [Bdellovibrionales bacterium]